MNWQRWMRGPLGSHGVLQMLRMAKVAYALLFLAVLLGCGGGDKTPPPVLSITTTSLPGGFVTFGYAQAIQATGGVGPFTWAVSSGNLPHGLILVDTSTNSVRVS